MAALQGSGDRSGGGVCWITGLSGAGKSTLAKAVAERLRRRGKAVLLLDGDELREVFDAVDPGAGNHGREERLALAFRYARLCGILARQEIVVVIATISLFREVHDWNRRHLPQYFEVYLKVPLEELRQRDPKGLYAAFDRGEVSDIAGVDLEVDEPRNPDCRLDHDETLTVTDLADLVVEKLEKKISP
ncbi:adenylyl-sulfate kinase [Pelagibius sp. CAU 1746]|uniref:adenylyl-sulfate kinase n=1 Tax=Pelagibius sp. CAU 1746 TaxID=3140370 RepID=UPI00325C1E34